MLFGPFDTLNLLFGPREPSRSIDLVEIYRLVPHPVPIGSQKALVLMVEFRRFANSLGGFSLGPALDKEAVRCKYCPGTTK